MLSQEKSDGNDTSGSFGHPDKYPGTVSEFSKPTSQVDPISEFNNTASKERGPSLDSIGLNFEGDDDEMMDGDDDVDNHPYPLRYFTTADFFSSSQQSHRALPHRHQHGGNNHCTNHNHQQEEKAALNVSAEDAIDRHYLMLIDNPGVAASTLLEMQQQPPQEGILSPR